MKHLAMLLPGIDRLGGAERQAMQLATGMHKRGWRVTMIALCGHGGCSARRLRDSGIEFVSLAMRKGLADPRGWIAFHRWLQQEKPHVLHAHLAHAAWMARWSRIAAPVPVVIDTLHSSHTGTIGRKLGYRLSSMLPSCVTAVSKAAAETHLCAGMVDKDRLIEVPNGIETETWKPAPEIRAALHQQLGIRNEFLWIGVGRLEHVKDYGTLLRALAMTNHPARLVILGDGPLRKELGALAAHLGLANRVQFLGFEANVLRWMQGADGFVLSSRYEGLPMAAIEAGACGIPAVATDVPGTREAVIDGVTGLLAPSGDPAALAHAMDRLMHMDRDRLSAIGERARLHAEERFSMNVILNKWEQLYRDLLAADEISQQGKSLFTHPLRTRWMRPFFARESLKRRTANSI